MLALPEKKNPQHRNPSHNLIFILVQRRQSYAECDPTELKVALNKVKQGYR